MSVEPVGPRSEAVATAAAVRAGVLSAEESVAAAIERTAAANEEFSFLAAERFEAALAEAAAVDPEAPLAGVPILVKDFLSTVAGMPETDGSRYVRDWVADRDSEYVARLRRAGAVVIGISTTSEMALLSSCRTERHGLTLNPRAPQRTTGGSSGGAAAAVAAAAVPAAHGSDAGGSIRGPAACCGVVGLKPTRARNPLGPEHGDLAAGLWVEHVLTGSCRDSGAFLDQTHGPMPGDPYWAPAPGGSFRAAAEEAPRRLRLALATDLPSGGPADPACAAAARKAALALAELGHEVVEAAPSFDVAAAEDAFFDVFCAGLASWIDLWALRLGREPEGDDLEPYTWELLKRGRATSAARLFAAIDRLQAESRRVAAFYADVDVWLTPTLGVPAVPLDHFDLAPGGDAETILARDAVFTAFLWIANMTGQPALTMPAGETADGIPLGVQLSGPFGDEETLLAVGAELEATTKGTLR